MHPLHPAMTKVSISRSVEIPDLADRLSAARERCKKPVSKICNEAGISTSFFYGLLNGTARSVEIRTLKALGEALGFDFGITEADILKKGD